jgi:hypothetical protein
MAIYNDEEVLKQYFNYVTSEEATIVFIAKNLVNDLYTKKKWVDVVGFDCGVQKGKRFAFNYIVVELFEKKIYPKYPKDADSSLKRAITWQTAHNDIEQQRSKGIRGPMFLITCHLYNRNKGKEETLLFHNWNEEYGGFDHTGKVPTTTITREVEMKPEWEYRITGNREIDDNKFQYIQQNYKQIFIRILQEKRVMIDWFFEKYSKR